MRTDKYQKGCDVKVTCVDPCHRVFDIVLAQIESHIFHLLNDLVREEIFITKVVSLEVAIFNE